MFIYYTFLHFKKICGSDLRNAQNYCGGNLIQWQIFEVLQWCFLVRFAQISAQFGSIQSVKERNIYLTLRN